MHRRAPMRTANKGSTSYVANGCMPLDSDIESYEQDANI